MKNRKLLYILIPATLLLWGTVIYKIVGVANKKNANPVSVDGLISDAVNENINDTFSIHPDYRDPFSVKSAKNSVSTAAVNPVKKELTIQPVTALWPSIIYGGLIHNQKSSKQLVLVQINGQGNIMNPGEKINDVELIKIFKDSIEVQFNKEKKIIKK